VTLLVRPVK